MVDLTIDKIKYGGLYHYFFWDPAFNPLATLENCLANCTCFVLGDCGVTGTAKPVSRAVGAAHWHEYLTNGWTLSNFESFDSPKIRVGDIIEWTGVPHVARVFKIENGIPWVRGSFYTGENGVSTLPDGSYDTRKSFSTMQQFSDFVIKNYPSRFYHEWPLEKESRKVGANPTFILHMPNTIAPVERDENKNQIRTTDTELRIRTAPNLYASIVGHVELGYYNVLAIENATTEDRKKYKEERGENLERWYEIAKDRWCGDLTTEYLPKKEDSDISEALKIITQTVTDLQNENNRYKDGMQQIADIVKKFTV